MSQARDLYPLVYPSDRNASFTPPKRWRFQLRVPRDLEGIFE
jgi:hypothetical protein